MKNGFLIRFVHDFEGFPKGRRAFIFAEKDDHGLVGCEWSKAQHDLMNINRNKKQLFPISVRKKIADLIGINRIHSRTDHLETHVNNQIGRLDNRVSELTDKMESFVTDVYTKIHSIQSIYKALESDERLWNISRKRWRNVAPNEGLTWGFQISGKAFIDKVKAYKAFDSSKTILELGPGYGRILTSILESGIEFKKYIGLDISPKNIEYLKNKFVSENIIFINADVEKYDLQMSYDIFLSSLVMKHLYPTFELALKNIAQYANKGCKFFFDLIEGDRQIFEHDKVTYIRYYTKPEVEQILNRLNLKIVSFDT